MRLLKSKRKSVKRKPSVSRKQPVKDPKTKDKVQLSAELPAGEEEVVKEAFVKADAERVFHYFREICSIPHGSYHTKEISDHLVAFAKEKGLACRQDEANNVIISKNATKGLEEAEPIALQGHIDMVLACAPDKKIDLLTEPVTPIFEGDWIRADGTTLGADDGIAVAMMLAILESDEIGHPYLECIFTSDEEVELIGANAIDLSGLRSRRLLNLDSEKDDVFNVGCAGGADVVCQMPLKWKNRSGKILRVSVSGLRGGHSGVDIHIGSANANVLMARMLRALYRTCPFHLVGMEGGNVNNAIPISGSASALFPIKASSEKIEEAAAAAAKEMQEEYAVTDPDMKWNLEWSGEESVKSASKKNTGNLIMYLTALPNGVTHMSQEIAGMPQTSLNMGVIRTEGDKVRVNLMLRSGVNSQAAYLTDRLICITEGFGGKAQVCASYPAWEYKSDSRLRDLCVRTYEKLFGEEPKTEVIHAGLECGILAGKLEGLDCLSTGACLEHVHTARERAKISSIEKIWTFVLSLLQEAAV